MRRERLPTPSLPTTGDHHKWGGTDTPTETKRQPLREITPPQTQRGWAGELVEIWARFDNGKPEVSVQFKSPDLGKLTIEEFEQLASDLTAAFRAIQDAASQFQFRR